MICISTRGQAPPVSFREALLAGLAPDGGLYVPATLQPLGNDGWDSLRGASLPDVATAILGRLIGDEIPGDTLQALLSDALDFPIPVVRLDQQLSVLELFHGPTLAFKDVGARVFARLLAHFHTDRDPITVLVATSGDTGGAVAHAFFGVPGTRVVVLYPDGKVSPVQEAQFATLGGNVTALAVDGSFDDCQRLAKSAFGNPALRERCRLTSANSISLGRLLPQAVYYAYAVTGGSRTTFVVPSGNFGNLAAGLIAWRLGAPIAGFVAATTINDTVPRYLQTGVVEPRPSVPTLANAMDVGDPSNLERLRWMFDGDVTALRTLVRASVHTDEQVRQAIRELDERFGYVADPHTAIAYLGATRTSHPAPRTLHPAPRTAHPAPRTPHPAPRTAHPAPRTVFLATAHPAKFRETVEPALGREVPLPAGLAAALERPNRATRIPATDDALSAAVRSLAAA